MPKRETKFERGNYYHIYNRGINKNLIFREKENYLFLLRKLRKYRSKFDVTVIAYCLMPNHYHFLVRQDGVETISTFVQHLFNSYTKAFNKKHNRSGTLFEGRFKAIHVNERKYLIHLCSYIHRNPIEANLTKKLGRWPNSNLPEWLGYRKEELVDNKFVESYSSSPDEYLNFLKSYALPDEATKYLSR